VVNRLLVNLYREARRRKVFRTAAYYLVGAWALLQVCDVVFPIIGIPDEALQLVLAATIAGFPVALIFGWKYDITPQGVRRTPSIDEVVDAPDLSLKRTDYVLLVTMAVIAILVALQVPLPTIETRQISMAPDDSIAVMPFEVCQDQDVDSLMAAGLAAEVINRLAERGKFKVLARESSFAFAGFGVSLAEIARPLGVQHVVAGTLCRDGDTLNLAVELVDADGFLVWSGEHEQVVDQSGRITRTLASAVASNVAVQLGDVMPETRDAVADKAAYEQLIIGREYRARGDDASARAAFERSLRKQPNFAEAKYELALLELGPPQSRNFGTYIAKARPVAEEALNLANRQLEYGAGGARTYFVVGEIMAVLAYMDEQLTWRAASRLETAELEARQEDVASRLKLAEQHFRTSIGLNPAETETYHWLARVIERQGRANEGLEILEAAHVRDPFNVVLNSLIAKRWVARGRFRQAIELLDRFDSLPAVPPQIWWWKLELMELNIYWDEKCETLIEMLVNDPGAFDSWGNRWQAWWFVKSLADMGLREQAEAWKVRLEGLPMPEALYKSGLYSYLETTGQIEVLQTEQEIDIGELSDEELLDAIHEGGIASASYLATTGEMERAIGLLESLQYAPAIWAERKAQAPIHLARLYQAVGREEDAARVLDEIAAQLEAEVDYGIRHPTTLDFLGNIYMMQNRVPEAIDMFLMSVDYHNMVECDWLDDPEPHPMKEDPRVAAACERIQQDFDRQSERVREMLEQYDVDTLLAPLMLLKENARQPAANAK
jgi:TolB-like protein/cytochrome c-type biogenesis protein CcmH/NrfG